jgi:hypothetical protein
MNGAAAAEGAGVLAAQIDLILCALEAEPYCLLRRAAVEVVDQGDGYLLSHVNLSDGIGSPHRMWPVSPTLAAKSQITRQA